MEQWEHAIEILKKVLEKRKCLFLRWKGLENPSSEYIAEDLRFPIHPLVIINVGGRDHVLE
jgi:hypothetical protein